MSENAQPRGRFAEAMASLPAWLLPLSANRGPASRLVTVAAVGGVGLISVFDLLTRGTSLATAEVLPVLAGAWLLSDLVVVLVTGFAIASVAAVAGVGGDGPLETVIDSLTIALVATVGRAAAVYGAAAQEAAARADLMARVARIATSADSLQQILDRILREMAREGLRGGLIGLINERNEIYPAAAEGDIDAVWNSRLPLGTGIMGTAAAEGRSILVGDLDHPDLELKPAHRALGSNARIKSLVVVPLLAAGKVVGVIELDSDRTDRFDADDLSLLEQIALAVSDAVQREGALQLADELVKRRVEELSTLLEAARSLAASLDPELVQSAVVLTVARALQAEGGRAALIRIENGRLTSISDHEGGTARTRPLDFPVAFAPAEMLQAIDSGHAVGCSRKQVKPSLAAVFGPSARSFAWAPVRSGGKLYGVVTATSERSLFEWPALRLLEGVADLAGLAVGNAERLRLELVRTAELEAHAERMAELEKVKSDFLKVASHELRGPLAILKGYVSMLSDGSLTLEDPTTLNVFAVIQAKLHEVSALVEQMLETARLEDSRLQLSLERENLLEVLEEAVERVQPLAAGTHRIEVDGGPEPVTVEVDRGRLLTIMTNLMENAIKYSPAGGPVKVGIDVRDGMAEVTVSDRGLGIAAADLPRLFSRFGRIVTADNSNIPGTGLGLYLARELARMQGGEIRVRSREGAGSSFTISLPLAGERLGGSVRSGAGPG
jgi:signal transduction histidine kinase